MSAIHDYKFILKTQPNYLKYQYIQMACLSVLTILVGVIIVYTMQAVSHDATISTNNNIVYFINE